MSKEDFLVALQDPDEYKLIQGIRAFEKHYEETVKDTRYTDISDDVIRWWRIELDVELGVYNNTLNAEAFVDELSLAIRFYNPDALVTFQNPQEQEDIVVAYVTLSKFPIM